MSPDIRQILASWPFVPDEVTVRTIRGEDDIERIQLRLDLGMLQMEVDGRPDGERVADGAVSWFDYHVARQKAHDAANPDGRPYRLEPEDCAQLLREGVQYYHRYLSFWQLSRYELCARDTERNLRLLRFVREYARYDRDKWQFDQWRPYVTMMHARAVATPLVELEQYEAALGVIDAGIRGLREFLTDYGQEQHADRLAELASLQRWRQEVREQGGLADPTPAAADPITELEKKLDQAVADERYEEAASLRDELQRLKNPPPPAAGFPGG